MKSNNIGGILILTLLAAAPAVAEAPRQAERGSVGTTHCTPRSVVGSYAFRADGTGPFGAFVAVGVQVFDGVRNVDVNEMITIGGSSMPSHMIGTYTLGEGCTGTMATVFDNGMSGTMFFVVADGGDTIYAMETDPGVSLLVTFKRQ